MPKGMLKTVASANPRHAVTAFAAAFPMKVLAAYAGVSSTALGVFNCVNMFEMVSITKELLATVASRRCMLFSTSVKL
jgi:hypothetical protein